MGKRDNLRAIVRMCVLACAAWMLACGRGAEDKQEAAAPSPTPGILRFSAEPIRAKTARIALSSRPQTLDPNLAWDVESFKVLGHLFEPLVRINERVEPFPATAETWEHDSTFKIWTFHLRQDGHWHDGEPVTAQDFLYGIQRLLTPETGARRAMMVYNFVEGAREYYDSGGLETQGFGVQALDPYTLQVRLLHPTPYFPSLVAHCAWYPLHEATISEYGANWFEKPKTFVGNGPYRLVSVDEQGGCVLDKDPSYWNAKNMFFDRIEFKVAESAPAVAGFDAGDLDMVDSIGRADLEALSSRPEFVQSPLLVVSGLQFNVSRAPFDDPRLRCAVALSLDRSELVGRVAPFGQRLAAGIIPRGLVLPGGEDYRSVAPTLLAPAAEDLRQARQLLMDAGYRAGEATPPSFQLDYAVGQLNEELAAALQESWKNAAGLDGKPRGIEPGMLIGRLQSKEYQIIRTEWFGDYFDPLAFLENFESTSLQNYSGYHNARFDDLLRQARGEADPQKRLESLIEAERLLVREDCVVVPLFEHTSASLCRRDIEGVIRTPLGGLDLTRASRRQN